MKAEKTMGLICCLLITAAWAAVAAVGDVKMTLNGQPAVPGDYTPAEVTALVLDNGLLAITFGRDGSATSLVKSGMELAHNLNGIAPRDPDRHRTWYIDYSGGGGWWRTTSGW